MAFFLRVRIEYFSLVKIYGVQCCAVGRCSFDELQKNAHPKCFFHAASLGIKLRLNRIFSLLTPHTLIHICRSVYI